MWEIVPPKYDPEKNRVPDGVLDPGCFSFALIYKPPVKKNGHFSVELNKAPPVWNFPYELKDPKQSKRFICLDFVLNYSAFLPFIIDDILYSSVMGFVPVVLIYFLPELSSFAFVSGSSKTQRKILPVRNIVASSIAKRLSLE